ncbi:hypothetical protein NL822_09885 [Klebsiella quasipneumoniae]|uniref:hypothetical protein n=1 Tax=Klebsiella quasipneumoniae TaxID=1463165 RepID=UPI0020C2C578|nr:hypothetical protein [Klebsiella quasipneumoniae]MCP6735882.1 hypothetical protein [Klebsiella quasipneumoniae]MCP6745945.1 hypothetical protein [Klebsiella quasipneumoniae]
MHNYITKGIALAVAIAASGMVQADEKKNHDPYFSGIKIFAQRSPPEVNGIALPARRSI